MDKYMEKRQKEIEDKLEQHDEDFERIIRKLEEIQSDVLDLESRIYTLTQKDTKWIYR